MSGLDQQKLAASRLWAATRFPYLASALFATRVVAFPNSRVVAVDERWHVYVDPELQIAWTVPQMGSMLVHHVGHLLREHAARARGLGLGRDQAERWVLAADAEINDDLDVTATLNLPAPPVTPLSLGFAPHRFAEEYFRAIRVARRHCECGSGCDGIPREWDRSDGLSVGDRLLLRCEVASEIVKLRGGLPPGSVPAGLLRWAEEVLGGHVDWRKVLAAEIRRGLAVVKGMVDYSYSKPSRRGSAVRDVILPGFVRPVPELAAVVDTSGSMDEALLGQALAEVEGLFRTLGASRKRLPVIPCDAAAHGVQRVTSARHVELLGGGGTNMGEGIAAAASLKPRPGVVVVLTDGYTPWPPEPPPMKVVVGLLREGASQPPAWARVVQIDASR